MSYKESFARLLTNRDGAAIAGILSLTNPTLVQFAYSCSPENVNRELDLQGLVGSMPRGDIEKWTQVYIIYWHVAENAVISKNVYKVFDHMNAMLVVLNQLAITADHWLLQVLMTVAKQLRELAILCDKTAHSSDKNAASAVATVSSPTNDKDIDRPYLENATRTINRTFQLCLNDRHNTNMFTSKKLGIYFFINELFKIYFILDKQQSLGKNLLKALNSVEHPPFESYPMSQQVTTCYYKGVCYFADEKYEKAYESLSMALANCLKSSTKNVEKILLYLIPTKIILALEGPSEPENTQVVKDSAIKHSKDVPSRNYLINKKTLSCYPRLSHLYTDLLRVIDQGNLVAYDTLLQTLRSFFINQYLYIAFERVRLIVAKNLLQRVYKELGTPTRMSVRSCMVILKWQNYFPFTLPEDDPEYENNLLDQTEGLISQLIFYGRIKGYISHERRTIVLKAGGAFV